MLSIFLHFLLLFNLPVHGFHLSQTVIEFKESEAALQITMSLTLDDLEQVLEDNGAPRLQLCSEKEHEDGDIFVYDYLKENFEITINDEKAKYDWIGKEINEDLEGVWIYLEITEVTDLKAIQVKNQIFIEALDDQKNIVQIIGPASKQGYFMFRKGNLMDKVVF